MKPLSDVAASVRQRLLNEAKRRAEDYNFLLARYAIERFLHRLSVSRHKDDFVVKGAILFHVRPSQAQMHRPTRDLDLLGKGEPDAAHLEEVFREVAQVSVPDDGMKYDPRSIRATAIRAADEYAGLRINLGSRLGTARLPLQVDIGFADALVPKPRRERLDTLLDFPAPILRVYAWETVIAEKFQAMVELGIKNSRLKDYFDVHQLCRTTSFDGSRLADAITATFKRRRTPLPEKAPLALTSEYGEDPVKVTQWQAFVRRHGLSDQAKSLDETVEALRVFLMPPVEALASGKTFPMVWSPPAGPWKPTSKS